MIGMNQIRKRLIYGILIGAGVGVIGIIITLVWSISVVNSYKEGTNEDYIANYTTEVVMLNRDVIQGETITEDMLTSARVHVSSSPANLIGYGAVGQIAKYNIPANMPLVSEMVGMEIVTVDERIHEVSGITLPSDLLEGEYVDIKIKMASGLEYVVIPQIKIRKITGNTIELYLNEEDLYYLNSAFVDVYLADGAAELYAVKYVDPASQIRIGDLVLDEEGNELSVTDIAKRDLVEKIQKDVENGTVALTIPKEVLSDENQDEDEENEVIDEENEDKKEKDTDSKEKDVDDKEKDSEKEEPTPEYINFTDNLTELLLKYAIEYRYYIEAYDVVDRTYQPSELIRKYMENNRYIAETAREKLDADARRRIEEDISEFISISGDNYEMAVSGLSNQVAAQQALRSETLGQ